MCISGYSISFRRNSWYRNGFVRYHSKWWGTCNKLSGFIAGIKSFALPFKEKSVDPGETINKIIELSNVSRKEGLLALEEAAGSIDDEFLKKGIMLVVDGTDAELVRGILETDMLSMEERHKKTISFWEFWGEQGPAWGMIGTLIGLINMLKNLEDSSTIGPNIHSTVRLLPTGFAPHLLTSLRLTMSLSSLSRLLS